MNNINSICGLRDIGLHDACPKRDGAPCAVGPQNDDDLGIALSQISRKGVEINTKSLTDRVDIYDRTAIRYVKRYGGRSSSKTLEVRGSKRKSGHFLRFLRIIFRVPQFVVFVGVLAFEVGEELGVLFLQRPETPTVDLSVYI